MAKRVLGGSIETISTLDGRDSQLTNNSSSSIEDCDARHHPDHKSELLELNDPDSSVRSTSYQGGGSREAENRIVEIPFPILGLVDDCVSSFKRNRQTESAELKVQISPAVPRWIAAPASSIEMV